MRIFILSLLFLIKAYSLEYNFAPRVKNPSYEKKIVVCIPSFNNENYFRKNLDSVCSQNYENFTIFYVDDASTDNTWDLVNLYIKDHELEDKITLVHNAENKGAMENWYNMVHSLEDDVIVVSVDGDDWLPHKNVLKRVNQAYHDERVWVTYGNWKGYPDRKFGGSNEMSDKQLIEREYRTKPFMWSHLRTFYAGLFKQIPVKLFKTDKGDFFSMGCDVAIMLNLMDMAAEHVFFIPSVIYTYNLENPIRDDLRNVKKQERIEFIIKRREPLERVESFLQPDEE